MKISRKKFFFLKSVKIIAPNNDFFFEIEYVSKIAAIDSFDFVKLVDNPKKSTFRFDNAC